MSMHHVEARQALKDVEETQKRTRTLTGYRFASVHFILWGVIMFLANGVNHFMPPHLEGLGWAALGPMGLIASTIIGMRDKGRTRFDWRYPATVAAIAVFVFCSMAMLWPVTSLQINAFISLLFALIYVGTGIWFGLRYMIAGLTVFVLTLFAYYNLEDYFSLWMALAYGGTLVVTGLWLRKA